MNIFYHGDCLFVMNRDITAESVDLIYLDPPFFTGKVQKGKWKGEWHPEAMEISFEDSKSYWARHLDIMRQKAPIWLNDIGNRHPEFAAYLYYMMVRLQACRRVLKEKGSIYLHCDWRASHYLKVIMDEIFGVGNFRDNIVWCYKTREFAKKYWNRKHDDILFYTKSGNYTFNWDVDGVIEHHSPVTIKKYRYKDEKGYYRLCGRGITGSPIKSAKDVDPMWEKTNPELVVRNYLTKGYAPSDYWNIPIINQMAKERVGYPTQKPEVLLERIIKASSNEGDLVFDPFCGCGTTVIVASKLNRQFIGIDIDTSERGKGELPTAFSVIKNRSYEFFAQAHYISRDLKEVQEMNPREFERWVNEFYEANKPHPDRGVDGITIADGIPIQTKTFRVGYETIDKLLSSSRYHPLVSKPIKKVIVVSQKGFDDTARQRQFDIENTEGIQVKLAAPEEMLGLET